MLVRPKDKCIWTFHNSCSQKFQSYLNISYFLNGDATSHMLQFCLHRWRACKDTHHLGNGEVDTEDNTCL